jgi:hypothetical protein
MPYAPSNYHICPCCSTEFGNDDADFSYNQLRVMWVANGASWFFGNPPANWNPWLQLIDAGLQAWVPRQFSDLKVRTDASVERVSVRAGTPLEMVEVAA